MIPSFSTLGSGPVLLMLHGIGGGHLAFAPQVERFAHAGYRAVAWDAPGYGRSAPIEPYTFKGLAAKCIALIEALTAAQKSKKVVLLGHSMGGMVAQELVAVAPGVVQGLVLACTSASFGKADGAWQAQFLAERLAPLDAGLGMAGMAKRLVPGMVSPLAPVAVVNTALEIMGRVPEATYRVALPAIAGFDRRAALAAIQVPTLLLAAEHDRTAPPEVMQRMAARVPAAEYLCLPGVGHIANVEAPDAFNAAVVSFLQRHFPN
jgi:3-oxoadipate enol-lactonase